MSQLTIGIPTYNRPEFLPEALRSALRQTRPVRVIISDNGNPDPTLEILASEEFAKGDIGYIRTDATSAWPNWKAAAQACDTEYFAWLQDDDVVRDTYAERIIDVMDYFPDANLWMARLSCAFSHELGMPYKGNCPWVPMDLLSGKPARWLGGEIIAASSYLTSWSLSPALAYRNGPAFQAAVREMPDHADIFIERLMPARMGMTGSIVTDPIIAGYWVQHSRMLHTQLCLDRAELDRQVNANFRTLDRIMDDIETAKTDWASMVKRWLGWIPFDIAKGWLSEIEKLSTDIERGPYLDRVIAVVTEAFPKMESCPDPKSSSSNLSTPAPALNPPSRASQRPTKKRPKKTGLTSSRM